jgi:hypothetical protein
LAVIDRYLSMSAPLILPTVTMTLCAMRPAVSSAICASAVSMSEDALVAPNLSARSCFHSAGSTANT